MCVLVEHQRFYGPGPMGWRLVQQPHMVSRRTSSCCAAEEPRDKGQRRQCLCSDTGFPTSSSLHALLPQLCSCFHFLSSDEKALFPLSPWTGLQLIFFISLLNWPVSPSCSFCLVSLSGGLFTLMSFPSWLSWLTRGTCRTAASEPQRLRKQKLTKLWGR